MPSGYDSATVLLPILLAVAASYVGLDLAKRMRTADRGLALWWCLGGSVALGTGIWAMHFIGMLAFHLPVDTGYHPVPTALSWLAAIAVSLLALAAASRPQLGWWGLATCATVMGAGICAMHYIGMAALRFAPGIVWQPALVATSAVVAVAASAVALWMFINLQRWSHGGMRQRQLAAASVMAAGAWAWRQRCSRPVRCASAPASCAATAWPCWCLARFWCCWA